MYKSFRCQAQGRRKRAVDPNADVIVDFDIAMDPLAGEEELNVTSLENIVSTAVTQTASVPVQVGNETSTAALGGQIVIVPASTTTTVSPMTTTAGIC